MKVKSRLVPVSIISLLCLFSMMLGSANLINPSNSASAMSFQSEQDIAFTINPTVNITVSGDLVINNLTPGDYKDSNIITVTASSNALAGYTLSSTVGNSTHSSPSFNNTNLNHTNGTNTFTNLATNKSSLDNFDSSSNTWGYSWCNGTCSTSTASTSWVSGNVGSTQTGYNGLPIYTTSSPVQLVNSNSAGSSTISFKIGARATSTQVSGTFANIVNFIGVGKVITTTYTISYNANGGSDAPNTQTGTTTDGAVQLSSSQPTKSDYIFKGWCTIDNTSDPTTCTGTGAEIIQPSSFLALEPGTSSSTATVTKTLYAVWESNSAAPGLCTDAATCMQTMTSCPTTATTVTDARDGKQYTIAPIGNACWMTTNLDLAGGTALSADLTDIDPSYINSFTTSNNLTKTGDTIVLPVSTTDSGFYADNYSNVANSGNASSNCSSAPGCYSYYSWDAATLGSGRSISTDNTNAPYSICPKGWHLPTTYNGNPNNSTDFRKLMIALGGSESVQTYNGSSTPTGDTIFSALQASPNNFLLTGNYYYSSFVNGGLDGIYWSATSYSDSSSARALYLGSDYAGSAYRQNRRNGNSVRCVLGS